MYFQIIVTDVITESSPMNLLRYHNILHCPTVHWSNEKVKVELRFIFVKSPAILICFEILYTYHQKDKYLS